MAKGKKKYHEKLKEVPEKYRGKSYFEQYRGMGKNNPNADHIL